MIIFIQRNLARRTPAGATNMPNNHVSSLKMIQHRKAEIDFVYQIHTATSPICQNTTTNNFVQKTNQ